MKYFTLFLILFSLFNLQGNEFTFIRNGKCDFEIMLPSSPDAVLSYGAKDFAELSGRLASGGSAPRILLPGVKSSKKTVFLTKDAGKLSKKARLLVSKVKPEGFLLDIRKDRVVIYSPSSTGVLYGVYEILKKYGKMRFLIPGDEGIYYTKKDFLALPEGVIKINPSFRIRTQILGSAQVNSPLKDTWTWLVRNNMQVNGNTRNLPGSTMKLLNERHGSVRHGGHAFDALMTGAWITCSGQEARKKFVLLQKEHPEYFPIIHKKRTFGRFARHNPCVAAPGLDRLMSSNLEKWAEKYASTPDSYIIGNNDVTSWCECEKCDKYDPVPRYRARIKVPNRYWDFVNRIAAPVFAKYPKANLWGWAYQNFNMAPDKVKPDPRLSIMLVYNRHCFRHRADDPACPVNKEIYRMMKEWRKFPNVMANWDQVEDALSIHYLPMGKYYAERIKLYKKLNFDGLFVGNYPPDGIYPKRHDKRDIHRRHTWKMNWMDLYISAALLWDSTLSYELLREEAGSLYYGKGWKNGMKEFHSLREKAFLDAPGCYGWGHDKSEPTRLIRDPFLRAKLALLLKKAMKEVGNDQRSLAHIKDDLFYFETAYVKRHTAFEKKLSFLTAYTGKEPALDGAITEKEWQKANIYSILRDEKSKKISPLSFSFRAVVGKNHKLFMALFWQEQKIQKIRLAFPVPGGKYHFLTLSNKGKILVKASSPAAEKCRSISTVTKEGICQTELMIPGEFHCSKLYPGGVFYPGLQIYTQENKVLVPASAAREGKIPLQVWQISEKRSTGNEGMERNLSRWRNGSMDEIRRRPEKQGRWQFPDKASPLYWGCAENTAGILEMPFWPGEKNNRYVKMQNGCILAPFKELPGNDTGGKKIYKLTAKCGGNGKGVFQAYWKNAEDKLMKTTEIGRFIPSADGKWHQIEFTFPRRKEGEWFHLFIRNVGKGTLLLDDVYIYSVDEEDKR